MKKFFFCILIFICLFGQLNAQNEKFKALFIYNFTRHILWPEEYNQGTFKIGIAGTSTLYDELNIIAGKKDVNGQQIKIQRITSYEELSLFHIIYIPKYNSSKLEQLHVALKKTPTVIITDNYELASKGADINFVLNGDYLDYEIFRSNILTNGLKVNTKLFKLGIDADSLTTKNR